ncbi:MAG: class I SAM-dependent methyltransferase, partial [Clostridiales bacterium]|nr:class I SAM-dependent methyltransferase [Clostridiales bacterium]
MPRGARVLEIGCGQGETTLALARRVGRRGFVHGVDRAPPSYGAPVSLGAARDRLLGLPEGGRIRMDFGADILSPDWRPPQSEPFDCAVFSLCSWYFRSAGEFRAALRRAGELAKTVCLAEWDLRLADISQIGHFGAALVQGMYNA